jgi:cyclase
MLRPRVIPALLLHNGGLVKTTRFKAPNYIGDPINTIRIFNEKEVDEILVLDINASKNAKEPNYELIEQLAGECFIPLAYGGGVNSISQARRLFSLGIEKLCIQTAAVENPLFITQLSSEFGSQSIIASIDIKKSWRGTPKVYKSSVGHKLGVYWLSLISQMVEAGAGEVLLNCVDKDGTLSGPDISLIDLASKQVRVPLIAVGGVSSLSDIKDCIDAGASAVAAGAYFVYHGPHRAVLITYPSSQDLDQLFQDI